MNIQNLIARLLALAGLVLPAAAPAGSQSIGTSGDVFSISISDTRTATHRLEIFDSSSERIYDSGPVLGPTLRVETSDLPTVIEGLSYELRAWDEKGRLVLSQMAAVPRGSDLISRISFDVIPAHTQFGGPQITLQGDVSAQQDLNVEGALRTDELRRISGASFFGSCSPGSSIRSISASGIVDCEPDDTGGGGGDNLGNHIATQDLNMGSNSLLFGTNTELLRTGGNARMMTGGLGHTLMFKGGQPPNADIAQFRNLSDEIKIRVNSEGRLMYLGGQKICSVFTGTWRTSILVSDGWTAATCASYQNVIASDGEYQLFCLFDNGYSFGAPGGGAPSNNCGW